MKTRSIKVEIVGDAKVGVPFRPKIRLCGHWLAQAGFPMGSRVQVEPVEDGKLVLTLCRPCAFQTETVAVAAALDYATKTADAALAIRRAAARQEAI